MGIWLGVSVITCYIDMISSRACVVVNANQWLLCALRTLGQALSIKYDASFPPPGQRRELLDVNSPGGGGALLSRIAGGKGLNGDSGRERERERGGRDARDGGRDGVRNGR